MQWKINVKEYVPGKKHDTQEYFSVFTDALNRKYITITGIITERGYKMYLSLIGVVGKNSMYGAPPRKSYVWFFKTDELMEAELVKYDEINCQYVLTNKGNVLIYVLVRSINKDGVPKI